MGRQGGISWPLPDAAILLAMSNPIFYRLDSISVLDISGADADAIVHNVTTNEVKSLSVGEGRETFVTDVKGKTLGHVFLFREPGCLRMIGPAGQSATLAQHLDHYTIREDATPIVRDGEFSGLVLTSDAAAALDVATLSSGQLAGSTCRIGDTEVRAYTTRWLGEGTIVLLVRPADETRVCQQLQSQSLCSADESEMHSVRTIASFPWFGIDLDDSNLPQEANRDSLAISFTKGCYLGQETVARLDALGQVQKKLVQWSIPDTLPAANTKLMVDEKVVGRLTSVASDGAGGAIAIGYARRSHFDPGASAQGLNDATGDEFTATVV